MYRVLVSSTFQKEYRKLNPEIKIRVKKALEQLSEDPFTPRTHADIKPLKDTNPPKYRVRIGDYRVVYAVIENDVKVLEIFFRGREYRM
jgi:mRNA interferase RelE/StbE